MAKNAKKENINKLIDVINKLMERQEKLLNHVGDLEEYIEILEAMNDFDDGQELISFIPDEEFKKTIEESLTDERKEKLEQIKNKKKKKEKKQKLHSMEDILKIFDDEE